MAFDALLDRWLHPWKYPDRPMRLDVELFPRWTAVERRVRAIAQRISDTLNVARHGLPDTHEDPD